MGKISQKRYCAESSKEIWEYFYNGMLFNL